MSKMSVCKICSKKYAPCRGCEKDALRGNFYNYRIDFCSPECYQKSLEKPKAKPKTAPKTTSKKIDKDVDSGE